MSISRQQKTEMTDKKCLAEALKKMGFTPTILAKPETVRGHYDERSREKCDIVLRREDNNRKADIGFSQGSDGKYSVVTDTYVNRDLQDLDKFASDIKKEYLKVQVRQIAKKNGMQVIGEKQLANGKTRIAIRVGI